MAGELNMPFEPVPDGPFELDLRAVPCGGAGFRAARAEIDGLGTLPVLIFDFRHVDGTAVAPIALYLSVPEMRALRASLGDAIDAAIASAG